MKNRFIPAAVMLSAGLICSIISILNKWDLMRSLVTLLIVLLIFYALGVIAARIIGTQQAKQRQMAREKVEKEAEERRKLEEQERLEREALEEGNPEQSVE